jgi:hypothetical protein
LGFYDLLSVNKAFCSLLLTDSSLTFTSTFVSYMSYSFCRASASTRSKCYARLHLVCLTLLLEDETTAVKYLGSEISSVPVRLCRQRNPPLPHRTDEERPLLCAILDCLLIFLRHNLAKRLAIDSYL